MDDPNRLNSSRRALLIALILAALVCGGLTVVVIGRLVQGGPQIMIVSSVDGKGNLVAVPELHLLPAPTLVSERGVSQLPTQLARLSSSRSPSAALAIFTPNGQRGFGISKRGGQIVFSFIFDVRSAPKQEQAVRRLFKKLGSSPTEDYLASNGGIANATRILTYPAPSSPPLPALCLRLLREIYGVSDEEGLTYSLQE
jgi:hypothetical protein